MARYRTSLTIKRPLAETFAFFSDFRNAPSWDPQTVSARKATDGDIGLGTIFVLVGGTAGINFDLPYEIVSYDPPHQFILKGKNRIFRYRDVIDFIAEGEHTRMSYYAELRFRGLLRAGNPLMSLMFQRIGDEATRRMPTAAEAAIPATTAPNLS